MTEKKVKKTEHVAAAKAPPLVESAPQSDGQYTEKKDEEIRQTKLAETDKYLNTGSHIGTKFKSGDMRKYIYKVRKDGLNVLDIQVIDERLGAAAKMLSKFPADKIVVVSRKSYGQTPAKTFAEVTGAVAVTGRFIPGTFTNPQCTRYVEPRIVIVADPEYDFQAIEEATRVRIPVIGMCSTNNTLRNIDIAVPINNKGRKSIALAFWVMAKEILKARNEPESAKTPDDFEYKMKEGEEEQRADRGERKGFGARRSGPGGRFGGAGRRPGGFGRNFDSFQPRQFGEGRSR